MKARRLVGTTVTLATLSTQLLAEGYMGASLGSSQLDEGGQLSEFNLHDNGVSGGLYGGYQFHRYVALEGTAKWLGIFPSDISEQRYAALTVSALGILPFTNSGLDGYLQAGIGAMLTSDSRVTQVSDGIITDNAGANFTWLAGLGIRYTPPSASYITIRAGYEYYHFQMRLSVVSEGPQGDVIVQDQDNFQQSIDNLFIAAQLNF
jgi:opacity protein-like surface antigen